MPRAAAPAGEPRRAPTEPPCTAYAGTRRTRGGIVAAVNCRACPREIAHAAFELQPGINSDERSSKGISPPSSLVTVRRDVPKRYRAPYQLISKYAVQPSTGLVPPKP